MTALAREFIGGLLAGVTPFGTAFKSIARWLAAAVLSALADAGLALIGIGSLAKAMLLATALLILLATVTGWSLMLRILHGK